MWLRMFYYNTVVPYWGWGHALGVILICLDAMCRVYFNIFLFDLILYVPVNNLSVTSGRVFLG